MKIFFTILCVAVLALSVSAQVQFGAVTGLNMSAIGSSITPDVGDEWGSRTGIHSGGVAHIPLGDVVQLRTGLIYSQKGGAFSDSYGFNTTGLFGTYKDIININLNYLEIPLEFAFKMGDVFSLSAGPYIAFAFNKSLTLETTNPYVSPYDLAVQEGFYKAYLDESVVGTDFGLNFGMSFTLAEMYLITAKYAMGLTDILEVPTNSPFYDPLVDEVWVNGCLYLSVGFVFGG